MERRRQPRTRRPRGAVSVEYLVILVALVVPFGLLFAILAAHVAPYYGAVEYLNEVALP